MEVYSYEKREYVCTWFVVILAEGEILLSALSARLLLPLLWRRLATPSGVTGSMVGIGKAEGVPQEIVDGLRANFEGECSEVGMYLAMARVAEREGYPEIAEAYKRYAYEEADHASRFAELLGEVVVMTAPRRT